jgi:hypothetical protein
VLEGLEGRVDHAFGGQGRLGQISGAHGPDARGGLPLPRP